MNVFALIPARLESTRLPNKPLLDINGMSMIIHVAKRTLLSKSVDKVIVCTDSLEIIEECIKHDVHCVLTKKRHDNGTERIAEALNYLDVSDEDIVVDVQGDEPLIHPETIDTLVSNFKLSSFDIMLPYIEINDTNNVNIVKISTVGKKIIYMSRMDIPCPFSQDRKLKKHLSIIAFTVSALRKYSHMKKSELEKIESIELLRALESGLEIGTFQESKESFSVDVIEDYHRANRYMRDDKVYKRYRLVQ
jgi:3-deoxy-manno-octulosonate cytidylyltransferase (CMP-KDO synthetase)